MLDYFKPVARKRHGPLRVNYQKYELKDVASDCESRNGFSSVGRAPDLDCYSNDANKVPPILSQDCLYDVRRADDECIIYKLRETNDVEISSRTSREVQMGRGSESRPLDLSDIEGACLS